MTVTNATLIEMLGSAARRYSSSVEYEDPVAQELADCIGEHPEVMGNEILKEYGRLESSQWLDTIDLERLVMYVCEASVQLTKKALSGETITLSPSHLAKEAVDAYIYTRAEHTLANMLFALRGGLFDNWDDACKDFSIKRFLSSNNDEIAKAFLIGRDLNDTRLRVQFSVVTKRYTAVLHERFTDLAEEKVDPMALFDEVLKDELSKSDDLSTNKSE